MAVFHVEDGVLKGISLETGEDTVDLSDSFETIYEIGEFAFLPLTNVQVLTINDECKTIRNKAFYYNKTLRTLNIGKGVNTIEEYAFAGTNPLTEISVDIHNATFSSHEGMLYDKNGTKVILGKNTETVNFYGTTTEIGDRAFSYCTNLASLTFPPAITSVGKYAFTNCDSLNNLKIPDTLQVMGYGAFFGCGNVKVLQIEEGVDELPGLGFAGMTNLEVVHLPNSVTTIGRILGEETFTDGGRGLFFDTLNTNVVEYLNGTIGILPIAVTVNFCLWGNPTVSIEVDAGSTLAAAMEESASEMSEFVGDIEGWYYDEDFTEEVHSTDVVRNYKKENGEVVGIDSINIYVKAVPVVDVGEVYDYVITQNPTQEVPGTVTLTAVKDWNNLVKSGYAIPETLLIEDDSQSPPVETEYRVTMLGSNLFKGGKVGNVMTIPRYVKTIGKAAFRGCTTLERIQFAEGGSLGTIGVLAFAETSLAEVVIPNTVRTIRQGAFYNCQNLVSVMLGERVSNIGAEEGNNHGTFEDCDNLNSVRIGSIEQWLGIAFGNSGCNPLSNGGNLYVGYSTAPLQQVTATNLGEVAAINDYAFVGCGSLAFVDLSRTGITRVGDEAFSACANLSSVNLGNGRLSTLGRAAFSVCNRLASITIPGTISDVREFAFNGCERLATVTIEEGCRRIGPSMFSNCPQIRSIQIPSSVLEIQSAAFMDDSSLTSVDFLSPINSRCSLIDDYAFARCGITSSLDAPLTFPSSLVRIGKRAFEKNYGIVKILLPDSLESLANDAFAECPNLITYMQEKYIMLDGWIIGERSM